MKGAAVSRSRVGLQGHLRTLGKGSCRRQGLFTGSFVIRKQRSTQDQLQAPLWTEGGWGLLTWNTVTMEILTPLKESPAYAMGDVDMSREVQAQQASLWLIPFLAK